MINSNDPRISALQTEAGEAGDLEMVEVCERASEGDPIALETVEEVIADGQG